MHSIQLELNIENKSHSDFQLESMQRQIDEMNSSMGKVRRKLFSELDQMKKLYATLLKENEELKVTVRKLNNEKTEWAYSEGDYLFNEREYQKAVG